ncbi:MAG: hypothetical protein KY464_15760 [Gemmatimonadetes bacterium]|nr:hypothetical protein [Gemmatimonadota bacterium]
MNSIFMHAWDLDGVEPRAAVAEIRAVGLERCSLAFSYHGGRVVLPRRRSGRVLELDPGAVYFAARLERYRGLRLRPRVAPATALVPAFIHTCADAGLAVNAWAVLCHNDRLGAENPDCCIENVFGDRYTYGLCPANPEVRRYVTALCADIAQTPGIAGLELEALGYMGLEHASLHDKSGITLSPTAKWLLSVCVCTSCRASLGGVAEAFADRARSWLEEYFRSPAEAPRDGSLRPAPETVLDAGVLDELLAGRRQVVRSLLEEIRDGAHPLPVDVRLATDPLFIGGKSTLDWGDLPGRADSATVTFFGVPLERMSMELRRLPPPAERPAPLHGGFVFHAPDCASEADVEKRVAALRDAQLDGVSCYCLGLAARPHLEWLASALSAASDPVAPGHAYSSEGLRLP